MSFFRLHPLLFCRLSCTCRFALLASTNHARFLLHCRRRSTGWLLLVLLSSSLTSLLSFVLHLPFRLAGVDESRAFLVALSSSLFDWLVVVVCPSFVFTHFSSVVFCLALAVSPCWRRRITRVSCCIVVVVVVCRRRLTGWLVFTHFSSVVCLALAVSPCWRRRITRVSCCIVVVVVRLAGCCCSSFFRLHALLFLSFVLHLLPFCLAGVDESRAFLVALSSPSFDWLVVVVRPSFVFMHFSFVVCLALAVSPCWHRRITRVSCCIVVVVV